MIKHKLVPAKEYFCKQGLRWSGRRSIPKTYKGEVEQRKIWTKVGKTEVRVNHYFINPVEMEIAFNLRNPNKWEESVKTYHHWYLTNFSILNKTYKQTH